MNLIQSLKKIDARSLPALPTKHNDYIKEFWEDVVVPALPDKDRTIKMFRLLKQYVEDEEAVFIIRTGNTRIDQNPETLRRGFLTVFSNEVTQYVYTDNDFATIIFKLVYDNYWDIDYQEFKNAMTNRLFPVHFNKTCAEERKKAAYPISFRSPNVGPFGYKVSHVFGTGTDYDFGDGNIWGLAEICRNYFPLGNYDDWKNKANSYQREMIGPLPSKAREFLKAHFLRFACPLNYVLTPKTRPQNCQKFGKVKIWKNDIGECPEFLAYAQEKFRDLYNAEGDYDDYVSRLMLPTIDMINAPGDYEIDITYGIAINSQLNKVNCTAKMANNQSVAPKKNKKSAVYIFAGSEHNQRLVLLNLVKAYCKDNPHVTYEELICVFNLKLDSNHKPVIRLQSELKPYEIEGKKAFINDPIILFDGSVVVVNNQVQEKDMAAILEIAAKIGYTITPK